MSPVIASGKSKASIGEYPLYGSTGIIGTCSSSDYKGEMILVARVGSIGQIQIINTEGCGVTDNTLVVNAGKLNKYIYYFLKTFDFKKITTGTTQPLITGSGLKAILMPILPQPERDIFVNALSVIEERIAIEQIVLNNYECQKLFLIESLFI